MKAGHGGSASAKRAANSRMAGMLKSLGIERKQGRCPVCYRIIGIERPQENSQHAMFAHISAHSRGVY